MVQKVARNIIFIFACFSILWFVRFLFLMSWIDNATIDYEIVPVDVLTLIVSSILTIWIGWYIAKKITENRFEKDILINDLNQIETEIDQVLNIFTSSANIDISFIAFKNNSIQGLQLRLEKTIDLMKMTNLETKELSEKIATLYKTTTNFDSPLTAIENIDLQEISTVCNEAVLAARSLIISINKK